MQPENEKGLSVLNGVWSAMAISGNQWVENSEVTTQLQLTLSTVRSIELL